MEHENPQSSSFSFLYPILLLICDTCMKRISQQLSKLGTFVKQNPILVGSVALSSLFILLMRKYHYKFVVYPQVGGRHNNQNPNGIRHPHERRMQAQDIEVSTSNSLTLRGWYIKHPNPQQIIVYFHQNAGNIGGRLFFIQSFLKNSQSNILIVSYRGFSDSDGQSAPSQAQILSDARAILNKGMELARRDSLPLFVFGRSLGGAAAIHVLSLPEFRQQAKGVILENTFTSIYDVGSSIIHPLLFMLKPLLWVITAGSYASIKKIKEVRVPLLFITGKKDDLVPPRLMEQLRLECSKYKRQNFLLEVENGTHNDTWYVAGERYFTTINQFMAHCSRL